MFQHNLLKYIVHTSVHGDMFVTLIRAHFYQVSENWKLALTGQKFQEQHIFWSKFSTLSKSILSFLIWLYSISWPHAVSAETAVPTTLRFVCNRENLAVQQILSRPKNLGRNNQITQKAQDKVPSKSAIKLVFEHNYVTPQLLKDISTSLQHILFVIYLF